MTMQFMRLYLVYLRNIFDSEIKEWLEISLELNKNNSISHDRHNGS